ncbi:MAG: SPFH domain-containing protein [Planctomycetota bacterium]
MGMESQSSEPVKNVYMQQALQQQAEVERVMRGGKRKAAPARARALPGAPAPAQLPGVVGGGGGDYGGDDTPAVEVRITGWWRWKRVIVPPNAYVVHTRMGQSEPLHCGLGISFGFDPATDSFLVAPATLQTIMLSANCICVERQGILVQGYVQWIIDDFARAYRKLDFSDPIDPMGVVNAQLREQAEAAIKDTVATMGIDAVLADKQPIIEELTTRLRTLAEGEGKGGEGLGLRIVTVQIKEAVVSSTRLWESLQRGFRAERNKAARLAELEHQREIQRSETEAEQERVETELVSDEAIAAQRASHEAQAFDREHKERVRRSQVEADHLATQAEHESRKLETEASLERKRIEIQTAQERARAEERAGLEAATFDREQDERARRARVLAEALALEIEQKRARQAAEAELEQERMRQELERQALQTDAWRERALAEVEVARAQRAVDNDLTPALVQQKLVGCSPRSRAATPSLRS